MSLPGLCMAQVLTVKHRQEEQSSRRGTVFTPSGCTSSAPVCVQGASCLSSAVHAPRYMFQDV